MMTRIGRYDVKRVYVAGPYSADNVLQVLQNIGRGEATAASRWLKLPARTRDNPEFSA